MASPTSVAFAFQRKKRNSAGNPSPDADVIELSPESLMATNRFLCEVCNKGFQREQNLQLHRRAHNLPWKLKQKTNQKVMTRKVYICPERSCVYHHPARALGDLTAMKKHFSRKHGEKKFNCDKCNKNYAVHSDLKAHNKICDTKDYNDYRKTFSRGDNFMCHSSFCDALAGNNLGSVSTGSAAGSLILGNHQRFSSPLGATRLSSESAFSGAEQKLNFPRASNFFGSHGFPSYTATNNMFNFGVYGGADLTNPHNEFNQNTHNSYSGLMMNADSSAYNILISNSASAQLSDTAIPRKVVITGDNSNNAAVLQSMGTSLYDGMKFDGMSSGGARGGDITFGGMFNNLNIMDGTSCGCARGHSVGMEQLSAGGCGELMYNLNNADRMMVGEVNNNVWLEPPMNIGSEYREKITRDFLGLGIGMDSLSGDGMVDNNGNGMGTEMLDSEPTTSSAEARPFLHRTSPSF